MQAIFFTYNYAMFYMNRLYSEAVYMVPLSLTDFKYFTACQLYMYRSHLRLIRISQSLYFK